MKVPKVDVSRFDYEMQRLLGQLAHRSNDTDLLVRVCYELNIRSYHNVCVEIAQQYESEWQRHHDLTFELILASGLNRAHVLENLADRLKSSQSAHDPLLLRNLALIQYYLEQDELALATLKRALAISNFKPDSRTYETFALIHYAEESFQLCIEDCDRAVLASGPSARCIRLKGLSLFELGQKDKAEAALILALETEPHFVWACQSLAEHALHDADLARAFRYFGKATYVNPTDPGSYFIPAEAFMDMKEYDLALAELHKLMLFAPDPRIEAEVHNGLGYLYLKKDDLQQAENHLQKALALEPELGVVHYNFGRLALMRGRVAAAERHFKNALEHDPGSGESWVELGFIALNKDKLPRAKRCFNAAIDLEVSESHAHMGLARLARKRKDAPSQLFHAQKAVEHAPDDGDVLNELGIAFECNEQWNEAATAYQAALDADHDHAKAANNLGYLYEKLMIQDGADPWRQLAIEAWRERLQICLRQKNSTRTATQHLRKLGVDRQQIRRWSRGAS